MAERVLVTGGAGFIGSHLVDALLARGDEVRVLDSLIEQAHPGGEARFLSSDAELVRADLRDREAVDRALADVDIVYHQGGMVGNGQSMVEIRRYVDVNTVGTATLLEAMLQRRAQFRKLVVASSMVVYGDGTYRCEEHGVLSHATRPDGRLKNREWEPICPRCGAEVTPVATSEDQPLRPGSTYGISKRDQEELCLTIGRAYRMPTVALRYLCTYGSRQALGNPYTGVAAIWANRLLHGKPALVFEDGGQRRDFIHVSDVVRANLAAANADAAADYSAFNIATGQSVTVRELADKLAGALGRSIPPQITGAYREGDIRHCFADTSRARALLRWGAQVSLDQGILELAAWASGERADDRTDLANAELRERGILR
ncbi:MAG TPA: SDR family NAD(P)-dependent oxidoreductase [Polyangiaceae bacterium]